MNTIFEDRESEVRSYCRKYPAIFDKAINAELFSEAGERYIDFLASAGSLNYGHNNPEIKIKILDYLEHDRIINSLDMYTTAKAEFLNTLTDKIMTPRKLDYKVMCCGPTGTNAVEAALKLARKYTRRTGVIAFSGAFHGMSLGALSLTTDKLSREGAGVPLNNVSFVPYDDTFNSIEYLRWVLSDDHSGIDKPAAIILETVQAEGGINVASDKWLKEIREICTNENIIMIVDDIQVGNGRTGKFFSFERAGIEPDFVITSKSISGFGLPMSLLFFKREFDVFKPAEHNGTFRGGCLSFVGATAAINYFVDHNLESETIRKGRIVKEFIENEIQSIDSRLRHRGIGLIHGIDFNMIDSKLAAQIMHKCFENHLILEVAGRKDGVLKILPPLTIEDGTLREGLSILKQSIMELK